MMIHSYIPIAYDYYLKRKDLDESHYDKKKTDDIYIYLCFFVVLDLYLG